MIDRIHQKLGTAGFIISIVALVAAFGGGAYAASGGLNGKQKKEVEKIAKKYAGKPGANGAPGSAGTAGAKGDAGANGGAGAAGPKGDTGEKGPRGAPGSPWTAGGTLPLDATQTGSFAEGNAAGTGTLKVPISFFIPLEKPLGKDAVHLLNGDGTKEFVFDTTAFEIKELTPTKCGIALATPGTAEKPAAAPGNLCVYLAKIEPPIGVPGVFSETGSNYIVPASVECEALGCVIGEVAGADVSGARLEIENGTSTSGGYAYGTWAVTGG